MTSENCTCNLYKSDKKDVIWANSTSELDTAPRTSAVVVVIDIHYRSIRYQSSIAPVLLQDLSETDKSMLEK